MTGQDLIAKALRLINVLASGEVPTAAEASDALVTLNQMLESWSTQQLQVFTIQRTAEFPLVSGQQVYTVGTGGNFNIPRPPYIQRIGIINQPGSPLTELELPLEYLTAESWADIPVKGIQSALPLKVWDDRSFPFRNLSFWPIPNVQVNAVLYVWQQLSAFSDLFINVTFPQGYDKAILYNLAIDLAPEYGAQVPPSVQQQASEALANIQSLNEQTPILRCDPAVVSPELQIYNWLTDNATRQYRG